MKIQSLKYCSALFVLAFSLGLGQRNQAFGQCSISFTGPAGNVLNSFIVDYPNYPNSDATFHTTVQDNNEPLPIGTYLTWCVDAGTELNPVQGVGTAYSGTLYPTCDPNLNNELPTNHPVTCYVSPAVWQQVNYILNHKNGFYFWDIQVAIYDLVGGPAPSSPPYPPYTPANVQSLLTDASANAASWVPKCGDVIGAIYVITNQAGTTLTSPVQLIMLEVPITCPSVSCVSISAVQGAAITPATLTGTGGCGGPYTFSATGLPTGLTLSSTGTISGIPSVNGTFPYTVTVMDSCGNKGTNNCSVTVLPPVTANCATITNAVQGVAITPVTLTASGGCGGPYTFTVAGLPNGLTMSSGGTISGTPTVSGTFGYTTTITDNCGNKGTPGCIVTVNPPPSANCVTINATNGTAITPVTLVASGGCGGPYTFTATGLPNGLTMSSGGTISGTPTVSGTFNYTNTITDKCGNKSTNYCSVPVRAVPPCQASVCGTVFSDCNGDGFLTTGFDLGVANVVVTLKNSQNVVVATTKTDSNGSYCFSSLTAGTYTVCIAQPTNCIQTAGTHTNHWLNNNYQQCWNENDGYQHCKGADGVDRWTASDACQHWKNSNNQDCWTDKYGKSHTQNCTYVSCDVPKGNCETFTLVCGQALTGVNFAYQGTLPKCVVTVTGPSKGTCGKTGTYTCSVQNTGTACFSACQVAVCGKSYNCPALSPGQICSFTFNYQFQYGDYGNFNCKATASCTPAYTSFNNSYNSNYYNIWNYGGFNYSNTSSSCTAQGSCSTSVSYW
jgi:hypothetical protein